MSYIRDVSKPEMRRDACAYSIVIYLFNSMTTRLMKMPQCLQLDCMVWKGHTTIWYVFRDALSSQ